MTASPQPTDGREALTVNEYVADYEYRGDQDYVPSEDERAMIEDAIEGYLSLTSRVEAPVHQPTSPSVEAAK